MSSKECNHNSPTKSSTQEDCSRSTEAKRQKPLDDQQLRAKTTALDILKNVTGIRTGYSLPKESAWTTNKRIPYLYYINEKKTILIILQGDITRTKLDAIVNAANEHMTGGGGVDGVIHDAAGDELYQACKAHKEISRGVRLPTGRSRILLSYGMSRTTYYIINTSGPRYSRYQADQCADELASCYKTSLALAALYDLDSIGFTAISCGIFGYPVDEGARVALETVDKEADSIPVVVFVLWDNHIYDAWKSTAAKLKLTPIDPTELLVEEIPTTTATTTTTTAAAATTTATTTASAATTTATTTAAATTTTTTAAAAATTTTTTAITTKTTTNDNQNEIEQPKLTTGLSQPNDESLTEKTEHAEAEEMEKLVGQLPSIPKDEPDTQNMDSPDVNDNGSDEAKPLLTTQNTSDMTDVSAETENITKPSDNPSDKPEEVAQ